MAAARRTILLALAILVGAALVAAASAAITLRVVGDDDPVDAGDANASARWIVVPSALAPPPQNASEGGGVVRAGLAREDGAFNVSIPGPPVGVEIVAVSWDAREVTHPEGDLAAAFATKFQEGAPLSLARGRLSGAGNFVELDVPGGPEARSVILHVPETRTFMIYTWPSGAGYGYSDTDDAWLRFDGDAPGLLARL